MKKKKNIIYELLFFIFLILITYYFIFRKQDMNLLLNNLKNVNLIYIFLGFILMLVFYLLESINVNQLLKVFKEDYPLYKSYIMTLVGAFYSAITPAASGGEPVEIYYMSKENVKVSHSTLTFMIRLFCHLIAIITIGLLSAIFNSKIISNNILPLFIVGILLNTIVLLFFYIGIFNKKLANKLIKLLQKILKFFKINNVDKINNKIDEELILFQKSSTFIKENKKAFIKAIIIEFIQILVFYSVPYFVYLSFGLHEHNILYIISLQAILFCTVSSLPLPGTVGVNESVFLILFSNIYTNNNIMNALLLHRGITFYFFVIINLIIVIINNLRLRKKGLI